ncbi:MAG: HlyD family type I secretion periplasmic adaptor subunit [Rhodobacteraceae bacterium]|nr:HlyD family type I secretion periplasmic adaptor subunit [Paracoccaceae bacterium]
MSDALKDGRAQAELSSLIHGPMRLGGISVLVLVVGLGGWASNAMLASAAQAPGVVRPEGERRVIQHLEGGIVKNILARDGQQVKAGDPLIELDDVASVADYKTKSGARTTLEALETALKAELDGKERLAFDAELLQAASEDPELRRIIADQQSQFEARRQAFDDRLAVLEQQKRQSSAEIDGLRAVVQSAELQRDLNHEEADSIEALYKKGLARRSRLLELQGVGAELEGRIQRTIAEIARAEQQIGEIDLRIVELRSARRDEAAKELADVRSRLLGARNQEDASADVLKRTVLRAPVAGVILGSRHHTIGAVVNPGEILMELIPAEDSLIIEAKVSPLDIENVSVGQTATITFAAFKQADLPPVDGEVIMVSGDRTEDDRTGDAYFITRIVADSRQLEAAGPKVKLTPGMPADVMIRRSERTVLAYLIEPFLDAFDKSFREE